MDDSRKKAIIETVMPNSQKSMQRYLDTALFLKSFVPNYSEVAAQLHEMTHEKFSWERRTLKKKYEESFEKMKRALEESVACFVPDYDLP